MKRMSMRESLVIVLTALKKDGKTSGEAWDILSGLFHENQLSYKETAELVDTVFHPSQMPPYSKS